MEHGSANTYGNKGCRCADCRAAWAAYYRDYRERNQERTREIAREARARWREANRDKWREQRRAYAKTPTGRAIKRRAQLRRRGVETVPYRREDIYIRDEGICHLCLEPVREEDFSIDHLVPISQGGPDSPENVAAAHFLCNSLRSDSPLTPITV